MYSTPRLSTGTCSLSNSIAPLTPPDERHAHDRPTQHAMRLSPAAYPTRSITDAHEFMIAADPGVPATDDVPAPSDNPRPVIAWVNTQRTAVNAFGRQKNSALPKRRLGSRS
jgi:hypothetical protein